MTEHKAARIETLLFAGTFLIVAALYLWIASPEAWLFSRPIAPEKEYYNLLVDGFSSGKLSLNVEVPAALKALKDPYDPLQNGPYRLHDASYFNGAYYLYFGVTPALVLFWPYHALTGGYLSQAEACVIFSLAAVAAALWTVRSVKARFFEGSPAWSGVAAALGIGLCTMIPCLLSRINIYEVAIASGLAFVALSVACVFQALYGRRPLAWIAAGSLCYGLAIASRPSTAFGALILLFPGYQIWKGNRGSPRGAHLLSVAAATLAPLGCIVAGMLAYNFLRFGNPLEFGVSYELTAVDARAAQIFSLSNLWYNVRVCLLETTRLSIYFPYVKGIATPPMPQGYLGSEDAYGVLTNIPVFLLGIAALCVAHFDPLLRRFIAALISLLLAVALPILLLCGSTNRYLPEFALPLALLTSIGALALVRAASPGPRLLLCGLWILLLVVSAAFNVLAAISHENLLEIEHPRAYARLARVFNYPSYWVRSLLGARYGPETMTLKFPKGMVGAFEPLMVSGVGSRSDYLYASYPAPNLLTLGLEHTSHGGPTTEPIPLDFDKPHVVTVEAGFLYPPEGDPYLARFGDEEARRLKHRLRIIVDGEPYIDTPEEAYDPIRMEPMYGTGGEDRTALGVAFTGTIVEHHRATAAELQTVFPLAAAPLRLVVTLPAFSGKRSEPLVSTGATGKGDLLYLTYLDKSHIALGFDHWGVGGPTSPPIDVLYPYTQRLEVSLGSFYPGSSGPGNMASRDWLRLKQLLFVRLNGSVVFEATQPFYDSALTDIRIAENAIGSSTSVPRFSGVIMSQSSEDIPSFLLKLH
jgi:hypothetical protein